MNSQNNQAAAGSQGQITWQAQGDIARVWIDHPGHMNAITARMWSDCRECFLQIARQPQIRVVVIAGKNDAFAAGADISEFKTIRATPEQARVYHEEILGPALAAIVHCPVPVVAAIDGPCVGGGLEVACACDIRIASDRSRFGIPINRLGFSFAPAEAAALVGLVGKAVALELLLEGRIFKAQEAYEKGLVNRVVPLADWANEINATADRIRQGGPHAARRNKWLIRLLANMNEQPVLSPAQLDACWDFALTKDYTRGIDAFLSKTPPKFEDN
jgi:enoyl-CoA hydratase/carnithine racemase